MIINKEMAERSTRKRRTERKGKLRDKRKSAAQQTSSQMLAGYSTGVAARAPAWRAVPLCTPPLSLVRLCLALPIPLLSSVVTVQRRYGNNNGNNSDDNSNYNCTITADMMMVMIKITYIIIILMMI